jgi:hypothetical protein
MSKIMYPDGVGYVSESLTGPVVSPKPEAKKWKEGCDGLSSYIGYPSVRFANRR